MAKKKLVLTFPPERVTQPITYHLVKDFDLIINILRAEIYEEEVGRMILDIEGKEENLKAGITYLENLGVGIQEAARDIILNEDECVHCGACTGACLAGALKLNKETWKLEFDKDSCVFCELCVKSCPLQAIQVKF